MGKERFSRLQELIKQDKVLVEVSRSYSGSAFGGPVGGCSFTAIVFTALVGIIVLLLKGLFLYSIFVLIGLVVFWKLWAKMSFYYFYVRSIRNYSFFCSAYISGIIRLRVGEEGLTVSYPSPWEYIFEAVKDSQNGA